MAFYTIKRKESLVIRDKTAAVDPAPAAAIETKDGPYTDKATRAKISKIQFEREHKAMFCSGRTKKGEKHVMSRLRTSTRRLC